MISYHVHLIAQTMTIPEARVSNVRVDRRRTDHVSGLLEPSEPLMVSAVDKLFLKAAGHLTQHRTT